MFPSTMLLVTVAVAVPVGDPAAEVAVLPLSVLLVTVAVPELEIPPP